jgi:hypothetical protein
VWAPVSVREIKMELEGNQGSPRQQSLRCPGTARRVRGSHTEAWYPPSKLTPDRSGLMLGDTGKVLHSWASVSPGNTGEARCNGPL